MTYIPDLRLSSPRPQERAAERSRLAIAQAMPRGSGNNAKTLRAVSSRVDSPVAPGWKICEGTPSAKVM
jgi:hypothetical protein